MCRPESTKLALVGRFGASNPRAFVVGRGDEIAEAGGNSSPAAATEIRLGMTVNGRADANAIDYYKLKLAAGQRVLVECAAERIDSRMDATLAVLDAAGRELARNRDTDGRDPLIDFTAPSEAEYIVAVYDFLYRGGAEYFYRLTVHTEPRVDFVFPPCGPAGSNQQYTVYGRNLPGGKPAAGVSVEGTPLESITVSIPLPADAANPPNLGSASLVPPQSALIDAVDYRLGNSNPVRIGIAQAPVVAEQEPANNDAATAQAVSVPCEYVGQFYPAGDVDWIEFAAAKGQVLGIDVLAHRLGLDSDPCLTLVKVNQAADGKVALQEIAAVDDPPERQALIGSDFDLSTDDPSYRFVVPEDAKYRLMVRDQFGDTRHDARFVYRLRIAPEQPDFRLAAVPLSPRGGQNPNQVAARFAGPAAGRSVAGQGHRLAARRFQRRDRHHGRGPARRGDVLRRRHRRRRQHGVARVLGGGERAGGGRGRFASSAKQTVRTDRRGRGTAGGGRVGHGGSAAGRAGLSRHARSRAVGHGSGDRSRHDSGRRRESRGNIARRFAGTARPRDSPRRLCRRIETGRRGHAQRDQACRHHRGRRRPGRQTGPRPDQRERQAGDVYVLPQRRSETEVASQSE